MPLKHHQRFVQATTFRGASSVSLSTLVFSFLNPYNEYRILIFDLFTFSFCVEIELV